MSSMFDACMESRRYGLGPPAGVTTTVQVGAQPPQAEAPQPQQYKQQQQQQQRPSALRARTDN